MNAAENDQGRLVGATTKTKITDQISIGAGANLAACEGCEERLRQVVGRLLGHQPESVSGEKPTEPPHQTVFDEIAETHRRTNASLSALNRLIDRLTEEL